MCWLACRQREAKKSQIEICQQPDTRPVRKVRPKDQHPARTIIDSAITVDTATTIILQRRQPELWFCRSASWVYDPKKPPTRQNRRRSTGTALHRAAPALGCKEPTEPCGPTSPCRRIAAGISICHIFTYNPGSFARHKQGWAAFLKKTSRYNSSRMTI